MGECILMPGSIRIEESDSVAVFLGWHEYMINRWLCVISVPQSTPVLANDPSLWNCSIFLFWDVVSCDFLGAMLVTAQVSRKVLPKGGKGEGAAI